MDLVRKWMSGAVMTNNSMEDVASKFGNNWGRLAAVIVTLAQPCEIPQGRASGHYFHTYFGQELPPVSMSAILV